MRRGWHWLMVLVLLWAIGIGGQAFAEVRYELTAPDNARLSLNAVNQKRENNTLVLYTPEYGASTRTNGFGVEVAAEPVCASPGG